MRMLGQRLQASPALGGGLWNPGFGVVLWGTAPGLGFRVYDRGQNYGLYFIISYM